MALYYGVKMNKLNQKTLKLFKGILINKESSINDDDLGIFIQDHGVYIPKEIDNQINDIREFINENYLNSNDLNKTFHKSWNKIKNSSSFNLYMHKMLHYLSYNTKSTTGYIYIPNEELEIPTDNFEVLVINAYTKEELISDTLKLIESGIALKTETIEDALFILDQLNYEFENTKNIKNKEALILIADKYSIYPEKPEEFLRYIIYKMTGKTLLIKNINLINLIKESNKPVDIFFNKYDLEKISTIFNRFKPLFLAIKKSHKNNKNIINKISKLSKSNHKPLVSNPLNLVTKEKLKQKDLNWLKTSNIFNLFKALCACKERINKQEFYIYSIRNGKYFVKESKLNLEVVNYNYNFLLSYIKEIYNFNGKKIYIPLNVKYAIPTSEKMFMGDIPIGTKITAKQIAAGIYWENDWGANDLDLSGINISGQKVGWDASYNNKGLLYSGDMRYAENGAVEYLYAEKDCSFDNSLIYMNVFSGKTDCKYKIIVGEGDNIDKKYMMNPKNLALEIKMESEKRQNIIGLFLKEKNNENSFVVLNIKVGNIAVSKSDEKSEMILKSLENKWKNYLYLNDILKILGADIVNNIDNDIDIDLSLNKMNKVKLINLFKND